MKNKPQKYNPRSLHNFWARKLGTPTLDDAGPFFGWETAGSFRELSHGPPFAGGTSGGTGTGAGLRRWVVLTDDAVIGVTDAESEIEALSRALEAPDLGDGFGPGDPVPHGSIERIPDDVAIIDDNFENPADRDLDWENPEAHPAPGTVYVVHEVAPAFWWRDGGETDSWCDAFDARTPDARFIVMDAPQ